jgi:membrane protease YdiL (CAAX protease family)
METVVVHDEQLNGTSSAKSRLSSLVERHPLASFFVISYAISWIVWSPLVGAGSTTGVRIIPLALGSLVPSAVAIALVRVLHGRAGVRQLFRRFRTWRVGLGWWLAVLLLPLLTVGAVGLSILLGGDSPDVTVTVPGAVILFLFFVFPGSAGGEEIGWRGFALPHLQRARSALAASVILGGAWGVWHLPLYLVGSDLRPLGLFAPWVVLTVALSVLYTWIYNGTGGSLLIAVLFHAAVNLPLTVFLEPLANDNQVALPFLIYVGLMALAALAVVVVTGPATLSRARAKQIAIP